MTGRRPHPLRPAPAVVVALLVALLALPTAASAATPRTTVQDVERRLMCVTCGTPLNQSDAPQADRERAHIERLVRQGLTEDEAVDGMVEIYGEQVLLDPPDSGVRLVRWLLPAAVALLGATLLAVLLRRWRRRRAAADAPGEDVAPAAGDDGLSDEDRTRLDEELARFR